MSKEELLSWAKQKQKEAEVMVIMFKKADPENMKYWEGKCDGFAELVRELEEK